MNLLESDENKKCRIIAVNLSESLKEHLWAMGVYPHATLYIKRYGWFKNSVQIQIGQRLIALGKDQARYIEICAA
ncbi:MAG TPA: FeoA family protein [Sulfuricurvum sp.]|nr:FeoA family protein [Sulfuricurvum sp.]